MSNSAPRSVNDSGLPEVREDPDLAPAEKETTVRFAKDQDRASVYTAESGMTRRLLRHPEFEVEEVTTLSGERFDSVQQLHADEAVVAVRGYVPVGALKVSACTRSTSGHASVVARPAGGEAE
jgi:hypothetical protein